MFHRAGISLAARDDTVSSSGKSMIFFSSPKHPDRLWGPPSLLIDYQLPFPGVRWPDREFYHSFLSSAEVTNDWSCTSTPSYVFRWWKDKIPFFFFLQISPSKTTNSTNRWPDREFYHSFLSSAEVTNDWSCTSTPSYVFRRRKDKIYFFFLFTNFSIKNN